MLKIIDLFCGAGGTSLGFHRATVDGKNIAEVVACVNHDATAIRSHSANFPHCQHFTEDVRTLDVRHLPRKQPADKNTWILWASLECTHFSNAKSGPRDVDSRTLAHALFPYIQWVQPDLIMIENVREFMSWGELDESGKPKHRKKGIHYMHWRQKVESMGYRYASRLLNSADFGSHQSRLRYFAVFAKLGVPIVFPHPTHDKSGRHGLPKWKPVREVLDLHDAGQSIFNRVDRYGKPRKDLSPNTMKRILAGLVKFVAGGEGEYLVKNYSGNPDDKCVSLNNPAPTITTVPHESLVQVKRHPIYLMKYFSTGKGAPNKGASLNVPAPTITTQRNPCLVSAEFLIQYNGKPEASPCSTSDPARTLTTRDRLGLATCWMDNQFGTGRPSGINEPCRTLTPVVKRRLISAFLIGTNYTNGATSLNRPSPTITANRKWHYLVNPQYKNDGSSIDKSCFTLIARMGKRPPSIVTAEPVSDAPELPTVSIEYFKDETVDVVTRIRTFMECYGIKDIYMRMLHICELKRIQGLGDDYILHGSQEDQKKAIGNAVVPNVVEDWALAYHHELNGTVEVPQFELQFA